MKWTDKDIAKAVELVGMGLSYELVGERFGVSRNAISGLIKRHAPERQRQTGDHNARINALTARPKTA